MVTPAQLNEVFGSRGDRPFDRAPEEQPVAPAEDGAAALAAALADPSKRVGRYVVLGELGRGGMGVVLRALDPSSGERVAIKQVLTDQSDDALRRFEREARLTASLDHPGIARALEVGTTDKGLPFLVLQYVAGEPLKSLCAGEGLPGRRAAELLLGVAEAVAYAHERQILHRDLKPHNVIVTPDGKPVVLDFGLARQEDSASEDLTVTGQVLGTLAYMAPEQASGENRELGPGPTSMGSEPRSTSA